MKLLIIYSFLLLFTLGSTAQPASLAVNNNSTCWVEINGCLFHLR